jgi:hypothetical protein
MLKENGEIPFIVRIEEGWKPSFLFCWLIKIFN